MNPSLAGNYYVLLYNHSGNGATFTLTVQTDTGATPTRTGSVTPTPTVGPLLGDCTEKGSVTIDDLVKMVNIAWATSTSACARQAIPITAERSASTSWCGRSTSC